jgi:hypothetical protein
MLKDIGSGSQKIAWRTVFGLSAIGVVVGASLIIDYMAGTGSLWRGGAGLCLVAGSVVAASQFLRRI